MFDKKKKNEQKVKTPYFATIEESKIYAQKFIDMGYFRPVYNGERIAVYYVSGLAYYMLIHDIGGICINIRADSLLKLIENPAEMLEYFFSLPREIQMVTSFLLKYPKTEGFLKKVQDASINEPERVTYDPEMEQKIFDKYGYPEASTNK